jgi:hypothetical protein
MYDLLRSVTQKSARVIVRAIASVAVFAPLDVAESQEAVQPILPQRFYVAAHGYVTEPRGDFALNTGNGFGLGGTAVWRMDRDGFLNIRADLGVVTYGMNNRRIAFPNTAGLIQLNLNTTSSIFSMVAGPQLGGNFGRLSPYVAPLGGFSVFWTDSSIEGWDDGVDGQNPFASTTNLHDAVWAYGAAGGATYRVYNGRRPVRVDFGARYLKHDDVRYLNERRIRDALANDRPPIALRGQANFLTYYFGANWVVW